MTSETRYMRNALTENKQFPSSYNIISGSLSSGTLANLQASDDVYMVFASALVGSNQVVEVEFSGTHSGHMPFLQIQFEGKTSVGTTNEVAVYNYDTGAYETAGSMYGSGLIGTSDATKYLYHILENKKYRDASGNWKVKFKLWTTGTPAPSFTFSLDYLHYRTVAYQLGTSQTTSSQMNDEYVDGLSVNINVWKVNADETETLIGSGVATVTGPSSTTTLSATWTCPATSDVVAVMVGVYRAGALMKTGGYDAGGLPLLFITEDLNTSLSNVQWTVYYAFWYSAIEDETYYRFGTTTYNSRIENFTWGVVVAVKKPIIKMDLGPHPRSRLLFTPTMILKGTGAGTGGGGADPWEGWFMDEV